MGSIKKMFGRRLYNSGSEEEVFSFIMEIVDGMGQAMSCFVVTLWWLRAWDI